MAHWRDLLLRTLPGRLILLLGGVVLLAALTAAIGHFALGSHPSYGEALWKALAHMIDPGSLGEDETAGARAVGTAQVLIGIVFLAGIVLTVLTEAFDRALLRIQQGDPAVREEGHLLVVGMNRTMGEVRSFLARALGGERPTIVVMLPVEQADSRQAARQALAGYPGRVHVVVGDPETDGFVRVCAGRARHIVLLSPETDPDRADLQVIAWAALLVRHLGEIGGTPPSVAAELRRGRNVDALWYRTDPSGALIRRFPETFDALVNDRNIGALLSLTVLNPHFSGVFLDQQDGMSAPELVSAAEYAGLPFGEACDRIEGFSLIGLLHGRGPSARARYLPAADRQISPGDRLIVIRDESNPAGHDPGVLPDSVKVTPARPGPLLILGFSDSVTALMEELNRAGLDPGRTTILARKDGIGPTGLRKTSGVKWIEGDPGDPDDISRAISACEPEIVFAAASPDREARAVISGRLARQDTDAPIVVEQQSARHASLDLAADGITVVATSTLTAESVALSLVDPALVIAREGMVADAGTALESLTYTGANPLPLKDVPGIFIRAGYHPLAVSLAREEQGSLAQGDHILALRRADDAA